MQQKPLFKTTGEGLVKQLPYFWSGHQNKKSGNFYPKKGKDSNIILTVVLMPRGITFVGISDGKI